MQTLLVASTVKEDLAEAVARPPPSATSNYMTKHTVKGPHENATFEEQDESDPVIEDLEGVSWTPSGRSSHLFARTRAPGGGGHDHGRPGRHHRPPPHGLGRVVDPVHRRKPTSSSSVEVRRQVLLHVEKGRHVAAPERGQF